MKWFSNLFYNAVWQFKRTLRMFEKKYKPRKVLITFDSPGGSFRNKLDSNYKGQRPGMPGPLKAQFPKIKKELRKMNLKFYEKEGLEADDIMAMLAKEYYDKYDDILIATQDKDLDQLLNDKVKIVKNKKRKWIIWDKEKLNKAIGLEPKDIIPYLALIGDVADNIKGIPGVGPKTAQKLLKKYTLKQVLKLPKYSKYKEQVLKNVKMVTILNEGDYE
jgi:DNA polymerase-1